MTYTATFYSFKGGSGRTTLLLNVAHALLEKSERVLVWDLDVEAPGVHLFPGCGPAEPRPAGFLEWLRDSELPRGALPDDAALDALAARVYSVPRPIDQDGQLLVLPAHAIQPAIAFDLARLLGDIGWNELFVHHPGRMLEALCAIRDKLIERFAPTFLLIDSRTGITDLGGLLTAVVPDCTVLVGNYGAQSTDGLLAVYEALDAVATERWQKVPERSRKLDRLLVASPVPSLSRVELEARRALWRERFAVPPRNFTEIPLVENLLYGEAIAVAPSATSEASMRYREVAQALRQNRDGLSRERRPYETQQLVRGAKDTDADPHRQLVGRAQRLFGLLGYELGASNDTDFVARERSGLQPRAYDVRCVPGELRADAVPTARAPGATLLLVAHTARDLVRAAADAAGVLVRTVGDLERQLVDLGAYAAGIRRGFESSELARSYVRQRFRGAPSEADADDEDVLTDDGSVPDATADALAQAVRWATGEGPQLWLVLGDYGTGKTSFFRRFAYELATRAETDPAMPIPIAIDLRQLSLAASLEALLQQHLRTAIGWHGNPEAILYLLQSGRIVLLFDAFDEMAAASYGIGVEEQLRMLAVPTLVRSDSRAANRVLITCRKNFFRDERQLDRVVGSASRRTEISIVGGLPQRVSVQTSELDLFNQAQVRAFLEYRLGGERAAGTLAVINQTYGLRTLAPRPILLEMLAHSVAGLAERGDRITIGLLYEQYARDWLEHASDASQTTAHQRERLLEHLAARLWQLPDNEIHYDQLADFVAATEPALLGGLDPQRVDLELRSAAFLIRSPNGHYRFSHKSFLEYFLARELIRRAGDGWEAARDALTTEPLTAPCAGFVRDLVDDRPEPRAAVIASLREILQRPYTRRASENAAWLAVALSRAARAGDPPPPALLAGAHLEGADLAGWVQHGGNLAGALLSGANLARAQLLQCDLTGCRLDGADLRGARLWAVRLHDTDLRGARLRGAFLDAARLDGADLTGADLSLSYARPALSAPRARFDGADLRGVQWHAPDVAGASFAGATAPFAHWRTESPIAPQPAQLRPRNPGTIYQAHVDPSETYVVLSEHGHVITVHDLESARPVTRLAWDGVVSGFAITADGAELVVALEDGTTAIHSLATPHPEVVVAAPFETITALYTLGDRAVAVGDDGAVAVLDRVTHAWTLAITPAAGGCAQVVCSPDGRWIARQRDDLRVEVFDVATATHAWDVAETGADVVLAIRGGSEPTLAIVHDGAIETWTGGTVAGRVTRAASRVTSAEWIGDRLALLVKHDRGWGLEVWNPASGETLTAQTDLPGRGRIVHVVEDRVYAIAGDGLMRFADGTARRVLRELDVAHHAELLGPDHAVTAGADGITLWDRRDLSTSTPELPEGLVKSIAVSPGGRLLAIASETELHVLDLDRLRTDPRAPIEPRSHGVAGSELLAYTRDDQWLVAAGRRVTVCTADGRLDDGGAIDLECTGLAVGAGPGPIFTSHLSAPIRRWRVAGHALVGSAVAGAETLEASGLALTRDGQTLYAAADDGSLRRIELARGTSETFEHHFEPLVELALSPDERVLAVADFSGTLALVDLATRTTRSLRAHGAPTFSVRWSPDGRRLITSSFDGSVRIWDAATLVELVALHPDSGAWVAGGYTHASVDLDAMILTDGRRVAAASLYADRCVSPEIVRAAAAGTPAPPLLVDFGHAERTLGDD